MEYIFLLQEKKQSAIEQNCEVKRLRNVRNEKLACELDELDKQDITCEPLKEGW